MMLLALVIRNSCASVSVSGSGSSSSSVGGLVGYQFWSSSKLSNSCATVSLFQGLVLVLISAV